MRSRSRPTPRAATTADPERSALIHLLRRTGWTATPAEVGAAVERGFAATVDGLIEALSAPTPVADAVAAPELTMPDAADTSSLDAAARARRRDEQRALEAWWIGRMIVSEHPVAERLLWFWHGHFATSIQKVKVPALMSAQLQTVRRLGTGPFEVLTLAVAQDPAMLIWLDGASNRREHPNENFARELMELFTLGLGQFVERDVHEAARAFTGWGIDRHTGTFVDRARQHDDGVKTVLGTTGALTGDDLIRLCCDDPACPRHVAARMWSRFASPVTADDPIVTDLVAAWGPDRRGDDLLRTVLRHPTFTTDAVVDGLVREPVGWVVGSIRSLRLGPSAEVVDLAMTALRALGQVPFAPPSVGGWPEQAAWLSTATQLTRLRTAHRLATMADLSIVEAAATSDRPDEIGALLGVRTWSSSSRAALTTIADDPVQLVTLALVAPEHVLA
jgi:uncharacterized protein (DUF1800 family)